MFLKSSTAQRPAAMNDRHEMSARHADEWLGFRKAHLEPCITSGDETQAKYVKTVADALRIAQDGERRALLFSEGVSDQSPPEVEWDQ